MAKIPMPNRPTSTTLVWLSYDLGVQGDYESLYAWLDAHKAKECGDGLACFSYSYKRDLVSSLLSDVKKAVTLDRRSRLYVIARTKTGMLGRFIYGTRRAAPWAGYAGGEAGEEDKDVG